MIARTPLDAWTTAKLGLGRDTLERFALDRYQLGKLSETVRFAEANSSFYRSHLGKLANQSLESLADLAKLPFTTADDLRRQGPEMLCLSQSLISRVVTLNTSGTVGESKRLWFTAEDQALTVDFFCAGMSTLVGRGDKVMILLPGERPGSVGELLTQALGKMGIGVIAHGLVHDLDETLKKIRDEKVNAVVGVPVQVLSLARYSQKCGQSPVKLKSVLLSTDYASVALVREVERIWACKVFDHYGMTEMGLGGGVQCAAQDGFHLREADLYFEIIDPDTGELVPDGCEGEIVFSTLTRRGMPLIRYRTGDLARIMPERCACGSILKRLDRIGARRGCGLRLPGGAEIRLSDLDEILFAIPCVIDFSVESDDSGDPLQLKLSLLTIGDVHELQAATQAGMIDISPIGAALQEGKLRLTIEVTLCDGTLPPVFSKRAIRKVTGCCGKQ